MTTGDILLDWHPIMIAKIIKNAVGDRDQREVASVLGITQQYVSMLLRAERLLSPEIAAKLHRIGVDGRHLYAMQEKRRVEIQWRYETGEIEPPSYQGSPCRSANIGQKPSSAPKGGSRRVTRPKRQLIGTKKVSYSGCGDASIAKGAERIWSRTKVRARARNLPFSISREWVSDRLSRGVCEVTGLRFRSAGGREGRNPFAPSIDRREPQLGYTEENCRLVVWIYNCAKSDGSDENVTTLANALVGGMGMKVAA